MTPSAADAGTWQLGDREVHRMGFGSMRLTVDPDPQLAHRVLRRAIELGVNRIDTAAFYATPGGPVTGADGPQRWATELIRQALHPYPDELVIATKVGPGITADGFEQAATRDQLRRQVEENLRRLGADRLDLVNLRILRKPGQDSISERFGWLAELRAEGKIANLGLSNVRSDHLDEARAIAPVSCVQNSFSVDHNREEIELIERCTELGIAYVPFFAIAGTGRERGVTADPSAAIIAVAERHQATTAQIRLAWSLQLSPNILAIPGTGNPTHLEANIAAASIRLSAEDVALLG